METVYTDHVTGSGEVSRDERLERQPLDWAVFVVAETVVVVWEDVSRQRRVTDADVQLAVHPAV